MITIPILQVKLEEIRVYDRGKNWQLKKPGLQTFHFSFVSSIGFGYIQLCAVRLKSCPSCFPLASTCPHGVLLYSARGALSNLKWFVSVAAGKGFIEPTYETLLTF